MKPSVVFGTASLSQGRPLQAHSSIVSSHAQALAGARVQEVECSEATQAEVEQTVQKISDGSTVPRSFGAVSGVQGSEICNSIDLDRSTSTSSPDQMF